MARDHREIIDQWRARHGIDPSPAREHSAQIREAAEKDGIVTMQADWTDGSPEVTEMMEVLGSKQVPVVVIFPAGDPHHPIVFRGWVTQRNLLDAMQEAGPSREP